MADSEWELSKENVQPLRKGRKDLELLNEGLRAKAEAPTKSALAERRRELLEAIDAYEGEDPLEPWIKCIEWTREAFPSGGSQSEILPMLELCLRTFCGRAEYHNDLRYLKLWMDYADRCSDPKDIYKFLEANEIGQDHALFYESYADYMESCRNYSKANDIFSRGVSRLEEVEELRNKYKGFLERRSRQKLDEEDVAEEGYIRAFGSMALQASATRSARPASLSAQQKPSAARQPFSNKKFAIFVDPDLQPGSKKAPVEYKTTEALPGWSNLATQAERGKENCQRPSKWSEAKVQQKSSARIIPAETLDVFVDEDFTRDNAQPQKRAVAASSLQVRMSHARDLKQDAELLREAPLRNFLASGLMR